MRRPSVDHITARFRLIDIVIAKQAELIEQHQQACRIAAAVDAIELVVAVECIGYRPAPHGSPCRFPARRACQTRRRPRLWPCARPRPSHGRRPTVSQASAIAGAQAHFGATFAAKRRDRPSSGRDRRSDGICGISRCYHLGSRCTGRDRAARHKRSSTTGNVKRHGHTHPEPHTRHCSFPS